MSVLSESSEKEPSKRPSTTPSASVHVYIQTGSPFDTFCMFTFNLNFHTRPALEKRWAAMLPDPDAIIVESRRVKCSLGKTAS